MIEVKFKIRVYRTTNGKIPFIFWLDGLSDTRAKQKIQAVLDRASLGNLGKTRSVGERVHEFKINYGPGYRVYFAMDGKDLIILISGGDKSTQNEDIKKAKNFWKDYKKRK